MIESATTQSGTLETPSDAGKGPSGVHKRWMMEIELSDKTEKYWRQKAKDVNSRYRDEKPNTESNTFSLQGGRFQSANRYNILYSNIQTICPALYNQSPKPDVRRRYRDADPVGKVIADIMERSLSFTMDDCGFDRYMRMSVKDSQLVGRGITRVKYDPTFDMSEDEAGEGYDELTAEKVVWEHVNWADFRRGPGRIWEECDWIGFKHALTHDEGMEQFPETFADVQMDYTPDGLKDNDDEEGGDPIVDSFKRAIVWEIWDKKKREVVFIAPSLKERPLRTDDDPLGLVNFYPIPRPLYSTENTDDMTPVEPFRFYEDQAKELDELTMRITGIIKMCKVRGIYDSSLVEMKTLLNSSEGALQPAQDILPLMQGGGLDAGIWMWPIEKIVPALNYLYTQREAVKTIIYEITGIADIMRGSSAASETLGAQQLKAQFGTMRLDDMRRDVQRFARDLVRMSAEIMAEHFSPETMAAMTDVKLLSSEEKMQVEPLIKAGEQMPKDVMEQMGLPTWEEVLQILRDDKQRAYIVDIETDSTVAGDAAAEQKAISELLTGISTFIQNAGPAVAAGYLPLEAAKSLLMTATRRFKMGREVEDALDMIGEDQEGEEEAPDPQIQQMQQQGQEMQQQLQQLFKENEALKSDKSGEQAKIAMEGQKALKDGEQKDRELTLKEFEAQKPEPDQTLKIQADMQMAREKMVFAAGEADKDRDAELVKAMINKLNDESDPLHIDSTLNSVRDIIASKGNATQSSVEEALLVSSQQTAQAMGVLANAVEAQTQVLMAPKRVVNDANGRPVGMEVDV